MYVWIQIDGEPVIAGRFEQRGNIGTFFYANSYIANPKAVPLDPINLPLVGEQEFHTESNQGIFGVLLDAGPDAWGQRVLAELSSSRPRSPLEFLLAGNGEGVGSILFSLSRSQVKRPNLRNEPVPLELLEQATQGLLNDKDLPKHIKNLLISCESSLGGARPKAAIHIEQKPYIAKFNRKDDLINNAKVEAANLSLARLAGFDVPNFKIVKSKKTGQDVLLIARFDFDELGNKKHYISAHSLLNLLKVREDNPDHGYPGLADCLRRGARSNAKSLTQELFKRMVFRLLTGDTDDHGRNHGFFVNNKQGLCHSPLFDALPQPRNLGQSAMPLGNFGREASLRNALSLVPRFGFNPAEAEAEITRQQKIVKDWQEHYRDCGVSERDIELLKHCFENTQVNHI